MTLDRMVMVVADGRRYADWGDLARVHDRFVIHVTRARCTAAKGGRRQRKRDDTLECGHGHLLLGRCSGRLQTRCQSTIAKTELSGVQPAPRIQKRESVLSH